MDALGQDVLEEATKELLARKLWESEDKLPTPMNPLRSGFASPVVAGGRVFLYYYVGNSRVVDEGLKSKQARLIARFGDDPFLKGGASVTADDVVHCFDALTGKTLWKKVLGESIPVYGSGKTGGHFTMCVRGDRAVAIGTTGRIYCLDTADGSTVWIANVGPMHEALQRRLDQAIAAKRSMSQGRFCEVHTFNAGPRSPPAT